MYSIQNNLLIALVLIFAYGCTSESEKGSRVSTLPYYSEASFTPHWFDDSSDSLLKFHEIPSFELINQHGERVTKETVAGEVCVVDFFFTTCPGICPKMTNNMRLIQDQFTDEGVVLLSHTVTPEKDDVKTLKEYALNKGVTSKNWHLLTGDRDEIYTLGRKAYFVEEDLGLDKEVDEFLHTENFVLVDQNHHIRGIYNGLNKASINQLIADIKTLKEDQ